MYIYIYIYIYIYTYTYIYIGTLFRIPLRTQGGVLSKRVYTVQEIWDDLLGDFSDNASQCLLFLKNLERITVHSLTHAGRREVCAHTCVCACECLCVCVCEREREREREREFVCV